MQSLDRLDRLLLHELDLDARQPLSKIARKLRLGSDLVQYRVQKFLSTGIISRFSPVINPSAMGLTIFKTYLKHSLSKTALQTFIRNADTFPNTYWLMEGYGIWDILVSIAARDVTEYQSAQNKLLASVSSKIVGLSVAVNVEVVRFPKHYLVGSGSSALRWGSVRTRIELDTIERKILAALSSDARISMHALASKVGTTPNLAAYRLAKLEKQGVILGYRTQLNYRLLEMQLFKVFVTLRTWNEKLRREMLRYCHRHPNITCFIQQIGAFPVEFEVEVANFEQFIEIIDSFRDSFHEHVGQIEYMIIKRDHYHRVPESCPN